MRGHFYRNPKAVDIHAFPAYPAGIGRNPPKKSGCDLLMKDLMTSLTILITEQKNMESPCIAFGEIAFRSRVEKAWHLKLLLRDTPE